MKLNEVGFRAVYKNYVVYSLNEKFRECMKDYPGIDEANCMLLYGYIDMSQGLTLEVLAAGVDDNGSAKFFDTCESTRFFIRAGSIMEDEFAIIEDNDNYFGKRYAEKIELLTNYDAPENIEKTREMSFLDGCRHPFYPDDVQVRLIKDDLQVEVCWARIIDLAETYFMATLLNEPHQDFGFHEGEEIAFALYKTDEGEIICFSDMNPDVKLTQEDLEGGELLRKAIESFNENRTQEGLMDILFLLRDSYVWIPCNIVMSNKDEEMFKNSKKGDVVSLQGDMRMIPDILKNGEDLFFPVFSNSEAMGEYGEDFSKIEKHFLEALVLANNNDADVKGIVVDAFTNPFVLEKGLFDLFDGKIKSRLE